jgi:mannose-1-phosphate guanylyltransferase
MSVHALVLAGGSGTRFWPASRSERPKQLLALAPGSSESLIARTVRRIASICDDTLIATGESLLAATREALPELPASAFLGEPVARNTAACIGWGTAVVSRQDPDAIIAVLPSDHHIRDEDAYLETVRVALDSARGGVVTTIGIEPTRPDTGYGYVEAGKAVTDRISEVSRFVEKPDRSTAERYLASGRFYWNSGMFFFRAADMLDAIRQHMPALGAGLDTIERAAKGGPDTETAASVRAAPRSPATSCRAGCRSHGSDPGRSCAGTLPGRASRCPSSRTRRSSHGWRDRSSPRSPGCCRSRSASC